MNELNIYQSIKSGYNQGARAFSDSRSTFWPELSFIKNYIKKNDKLLDFGCGNGRLIDLLKHPQKNYLGIDISHQLVKIARKLHPGYKFQFINFNNPQEPKNLPQKYFDIITSIAVFHHFPKGQRRSLILKKIKSLLKPQGRLIITVWNLYQPRFKKFFPKNKKNGYIPFKKGNKILFTRYFYRWQKKQLEKFIQKNNLRIIKSGLSRRNKQPVNIFVIGENIEEK
ncbi:MAG: class I SAM-dependent methyltransferase [Patescibacteria group bacterium]|nr:class I SAM-dependent methyltransferase [Patescibacteria group bacterium]